MKKLRLIISALLVMTTMTSATADNKIKVVGQNVQNFFYTLDRTRTQGNGVAMSNYNTEEGRTKKLNAIIDALSPYKADIYAFNEVEAKPEAMQLIATTMSRKTGLTYTAIEDGFDYVTTDDSEPSGVIKSGYIYNTATVKPYDTSFATGWGFVYQRQMRLQTFEEIATGERFALSINHYKAGSADDVDGNGVSNSSKRIDNSTALLQNLTQALDPDILIIGDLNCEVGEECLNMIENAGYAEQLIKYAGSTAYTHCWGGGEIIDHVYANSTMAEQVTNVEVLAVANTCSVDYDKAYSDHNPYLVELELKHYDNGLNFVKATEVKDGGDYLIVSTFDNQLVAAKPVAENKNYDYIYTTDVEEINGTITMTNELNLFTLEDAGENKFYIKDSYGRYCYQGKNNSTGKYYTSVNVSTSKSQAHAFTFTRQTDGTFKILNTVSNDFFQSTLYNGSTKEFIFYKSLSTGNRLPYIYGRKVATAIKHVSYDAPANGCYNLKGQRVMTPTKGLYVINGRKVFMR